MAALLRWSLRAALALLVLYAALAVVLDSCPSRTLRVEPLERRSGAPVVDGDLELISPFAVDFGWREGTLGALFFDPARRYAEVLGVEGWALEYVSYPFATSSKKRRFKARRSAAAFRTCPPRGARRRPA